MPPRSRHQLPAEQKAGKQGKGAALTSHGRASEALCSPGISPKDVRNPDKDRLCFITERKTCACTHACTGLRKTLTTGLPLWTPWVGDRATRRPCAGLVILGPKHRFNYRNGLTMDLLSEEIQNSQSRIH